MPTRFFSLGCQGKVSRHLAGWSDCVCSGCGNPFLRCSCQCLSIHLGLQPVSAHQDALQPLSLLLLQEQEQMAADTDFTS